MNQFRYSASTLLAAILAIVLFLGSLGPSLDQQSTLGSAFQGLCLCTLLFMLLCGMFGHSALRTILLSGGFYAWGWISLFVTYQLNPGLDVRWLLSLIGIGYFLWALFDDGMSNDMTFVER